VSLCALQRITNSTRTAIDSKYHTEYNDWAVRRGDRMMRGAREPEHRPVAAKCFRTLSTFVKAPYSTGWPQAGLRT